jgi:hypothetical protein
MKRFFYIFLLGLLGLLISILLHAGIEMFALDFIFENPERFAETIWWQQWDIIHWSVSVFLWLGGLVVGLYLGVVWWKPYGSRRGFYHWRGGR